MSVEWKQRLKYILGDLVTAHIAWLLYNCVRFAFGGTGFEESLSSFLCSERVMVGQLLFPLLMLFVYYLSGYYNEVFRKSRLKELVMTFFSSMVNTVIIFIIALTNDMMPSSRSYNYEIIFILFALLFVFTYSLRGFFTSCISHKIKSRQLSFRTLVIGAGTASAAFVDKLEEMRLSLGYNVVGFVAIPGESTSAELHQAVYSLDDIAKVCESENVQELIVVPTRNDLATIMGTVDRLFSLNLPIKMTLDRYNILFSRARLSDFSGDPLMDISSSSMDDGEKNIKRVIDFTFSATMLVLLAPVFLITAIWIKLDSKGPVFYSQQRVGRHNVPFQIYKFRSMCADAEAGGHPQLSSDNDPRITRLGRVLRKYRIDELPQFWNVLRGDMSLVGPRPERQFFVRQILEREPAYSLIHQVRPGITSLGMVKFGYAKNVDEMLERLRYDLLYLDNMSLMNDLKILVYTVKIVFKGRGV